VSNKIKKPKKGDQGPTWAIKGTDDDDVTIVSKYVTVKSLTAR
jgi:hypothetical protein